MNLNNSRLVLCNSNNFLFSIIIYSNKDEEMVIDYKNNLVMKKDDYFEIFNIKVLNEVDKLDLYKLFQLIDYVDNIYCYLLFSKEICKDLSRNFKFINETYDENGINKSIYMLFDDCIFFQEIDYINEKMDIINKIDEFTLGNEVEDIKYNGVSYEISGYSFYILSDYIVNEKMCNILKSKDRYGECHTNSIKLSFLLKYLGENDIYIVGGKIKVNEIDYIYHSWIEIPSKNVVIDFNRNMIMKIEDYYNLFSSISINKTHVDEMSDILDLLNDFDFYPSIINYFGDNIIKDIIKSKVVL